MEPATLELPGRRLVELRRTVELRAAIPMRIDGTLQGVAAGHPVPLRRDARRNRDLDELRGRLAAPEAKP